MTNLVKYTSSLGRDIKGLTKRIRPVKSLSAQQILEALVLVADEADKKFTLKMLDQFWHPFEGKFPQYIRDRAAYFNLNERPLYHPHEPIGGYASHHTRLQKKDITNFQPHLTIINPNLSEQTSETDELLVVSFHIWHAMGSSTHYFNASSVNKIHEMYLRIRGIREQSEVEREIVEILKPHQINPQRTGLETLTSQKRDLFEYHQRLFTLPQKRENPQDNDGGWVDIIWGLGLYTSWPQPLGYVQLNEQLRDKRMIFLSTSH